MNSNTQPSDKKTLKVTFPPNTDDVVFGPTPPVYEWEKRFNKEFNSDDLHVSGRKRFIDFIRAELASQREELIGTIKEFWKSFDETRGRDIYPMKEVRDATFESILSLLEKESELGGKE